MSICMTGSTVSSARNCLACAAPRHRCKHTHAVYANRPHELFCLTASDSPTEAGREFSSCGDNSQTIRSTLALCMALEKEGRKCFRSIQTCLRRS